DGGGVPIELVRARADSSAGVPWATWFSQPTGGTGWPAAPRYRASRPARKASHSSPTPVPSPPPSSLGCPSRLPLHHMLTPSPSASPRHHRQRRVGDRGPPVAPRRDLRPFTAPPGTGRLEEEGKRGHDDDPYGIDPTGDTPAGHVAPGGAGRLARRRTGDGTGRPARRPARRAAHSGPGRSGARHEDDGRRPWRASPPLPGHPWPQSPRRARPLDVRRPAGGIAGARAPRRPDGRGRP